MKSTNPDMALGKFLASDSKDARAFIDQFKASNLKKILVDAKGKPLDLKWYIKETLDSLAIAEKASERQGPLDNIMELIKLGASQDEGFQKSLATEGPKKAMIDPFKGESPEKPQLRIAK